MKPYLELLRPRHWIKNAAVLCALPFGMLQHGLACLPTLAAAFGAFCLAASAIYALNDVLDRREDLEHPAKRHRPVARGAVSPTAAMLMSAALAAGAMGLSTFIPDPTFRFEALVGGYLVLMVAYSIMLKHQVILDVIVIATGFVIRASAGAVAASVYISPWLIVCTFTLCLFLGFGKRRSEVSSIADAASAQKHRRTLASYTPDLLNQLLSMSATIALVTFLVYILDDDIETVFHKRRLIYTFPLAVYGIFRYAMVIESGTLTGPTEIILKDRGLFAVIGLWGMSCLAIVYFTRL